MTTNTSGLKTQTFVTGSVVRHGNAIVVPDAIRLTDAVAILQRKIEEENQDVSRSSEFANTPLEVAYAFRQAIEDVCGAALAKAKITIFGAQPPHEISVQVGPTEWVQVPWGQFVFPFDPKHGKLSTGMASRDGMAYGTIEGVFKRKYLPVWEKLVSVTRDHLDKRSLFKGRTLRVRFRDGEGEPLPFPEIRYWDVREASTSSLVFNRDLQRSIDELVFTPIRQYKEVLEAGTPFKRGVLLAGKYGTGKTLLAAAVAQLGSKVGMTCVYIEDVGELPEALRFMATLAPGVLFAEDLDRVTSGERNRTIEQLMNTLDGIDTKSFPIMTVLTTNYPDKVYKGMVRPGRIDVALEILPPDAEAAVRLVDTYLGYRPDQNVESDALLGERLQGMIPAVIREICERSKLAYINRTTEAPEDGDITTEDVISAANGMINQVALLNDVQPVPTLPLGEHLKAIAAQLGQMLPPSKPLTKNETREVVAEVVNR